MTIELKRPKTSPPEKIIVTDFKYINSSSGWDILLRCPNSQSHNHNDDHWSCNGSSSERRVHCPVCGFAANFWEENKAHFQNNQTKDNPTKNKRNKVRIAYKKFDVAYTYCDADGVSPLHRTCKINKGKQFWQECYDPVSKRWWHGLTLPEDPKPGAVEAEPGEPVKIVLYNLYRVLQNPTETVHILEGEKSCKRAWMDLGLIATTNPMGAKYWRPEFDVPLKNRNVVAIPDNDKDGEYHVKRVAESNVRNTKSFKIVHLPELKLTEDFDDWLDNMEKNEVEGKLLTYEEIRQDLKRYIDSEKEYKSEEVIGGEEPPTIIHEVSQEKLNSLLEKAIPKKGFIRQYIDTFSGITDCPKSFLFWGAITLIATVLGKNAYINWEARKLYPNIWCVFLAPSGSRKGTGIDFVVKILRALNPELLLPTISSEEGLIKSLDTSIKGVQMGLIRWQEFARILSSWDSKQKSWKTSKEFLIDIYDGKAFKKKLTKDEFNIGETAVSFLGACIPDSFNKHFSTEDIDSGLFGRMFLINVKKKDKHLTIPPAIPEVEFEKLVTAAREIWDGYYEQEISYSVIKEDFTNWSNKTYSEKEAGFLNAFYARIETHAMKLAMIYLASCGEQSIISKEDFQYAVNAINFLIESSRVMVSETIGLNEEQRLIKSIEEYIKEKKKVYKKDVMTKFHLQWRSLTEIEKTLEERDVIEVVEESIEYKRGRRKKMYVFN